MEGAPTTAPPWEDGDAVTPRPPDGVSRPAAKRAYADGDDDEAYKEAK